MMQTCVCGLCGAPARLVFARHWAFKAPATFDIYDCANCDTRFAAPMAVAPGVYDLIYQHAGRVPGYDRYERYRRDLPRQADPLAYLARQEDVYWAIGQALRELDAGPQRILEIGSGFGYLTYALRRAGHDCHGIDLCAPAVAAARRDFGDFYSATDLMRMPDDGPAFDLIVATELIEHVPAPPALLAKAHGLLKPGGRLIVTTPNKDLYSARFVWHTDPPPVHLWWFSKTSLRRMAWRLDMSVGFVDFSGFYGGRRAASLGPTKPQTFDAAGRLTFRDTAVNTLARALMTRRPGLSQTLARVFLAVRGAGRLRGALYRDSLSLCAVMRKAA